jgi:hypothetical protein
VKLRDLFNDVVDRDKLSKTACWVHVSAITLTIGFLKEAWQRSLSFETFVGYAIAVAIAVGGAPTAMKFVAFKYGGASSSSSVSTTTPAPSVPPPSAPVS